MCICNVSACNHDSCYEVLRELTRGHPSVELLPALGAKAEGARLELRVGRAGGGREASVGMGRGKANRAVSSVASGAQSVNSSLSSEVVTAGATCPAAQQDNECRDCRNCWNPEIKVIKYGKH